jgi:hypothetical protein
MRDLSSQKRLLLYKKLRLRQHSPKFSEIQKFVLLFLRIAFLIILTPSEKAMANAGVKEKG